jgi:hypothetical protein
MIMLNNLIYFEKNYHQHSDNCKQYDFYEKHDDYEEDINSHDLLGLNIILIVIILISSIFILLTNHFDKSCTTCNVHTIVLQPSDIVNNYLFDNESTIPYYIKSPVK